MDLNLWQHTLDQDRKIAEELRSSMDAILAQVQSAGLPPTIGGLVNDLAEKIHGNLAIRLAQIENKYWPRKDEITDWQKRFKTELDKPSSTDATLPRNPTDGQIQEVQVRLLRLETEMLQADEKIQQLKRRTLSPEGNDTLNDQVEQLVAWRSSSFLQRLRWLLRGC